jgi:hypothetical protein
LLFTTTHSPARRLRRGDRELLIALALHGLGLGRQWRCRRRYLVPTSRRGYASAEPYVFEHRIGQTLFYNALLFQT